jgi:hypothetical protein
VPLRHGQWASETVPVLRRTRIKTVAYCFGSLGDRHEMTSKDQLDFFLTASCINLSNWGKFVGLEALTG